ncbi:MAG: hypothetical protein IJI96_03450 [Methanobrevibacter sp.]|nr:hypothetical protein [Methanobrevibacter sp.]
MLVEKCRYCGKLFIRKHNAEKYCSQHCRYEAHLESNRKYINKRNRQRTYNTRVKNLTTLGSKGTISSPHRNLDFKQEARIIKSQLRMIKTKQ